ncbi:unnamed protein product [Ectocarpus fasciculatus]
MSCLRPQPHRMMIYLRNTTGMFLMVRSGVLALCALTLCLSAENRLVRQPCSFVLEISFKGTHRLPIATVLGVRSARGLVYERSLGPISFRTRLFSSQRNFAQACEERPQQAVNCTMG